MHVAIVGAGALGCVYGALLARAGTSVTLVVRLARVKDTSAVRIERTDGDDAIAWDAPPRAAEVPPHADVVIVAVRQEQLDDALIDQLRAGPDVPLVVITPMMPGDHERLSRALPSRVFAAMPSVVSYVRDDGVVRYWLPRVAHTLIEERAEKSTRPPAIEALVGALEAAKIPSRIELGVHESNPATTVSFVPLAMAIDAAGGVDALLDDDALLRLALDAADEGRDLASRIGKVATWANLLLKFVNATTLKMGVKLAKSRASEAVFYVEEHFGRKLHAQNVRMAEQIVALAVEKGAPHDALDRLLARLRAHDGAPS